MNKTHSLILGIIVIAALGFGYYSLVKAPAPIPAPEEATSTAPVFVSTFGYSFTYPEGWAVTAKSAADTGIDATREFPGATVLSVVSVGPDVTAYEVESPAMTITDEPNGHASPIEQTKYFYANGAWMVAYPETAFEGSNRATTTAVAESSTDGGLMLLRAGRRFDTTIIPLSPTKFVVFTSNGGEAATPIARTVRPR